MRIKENDYIEVTINDIRYYGVFFKYGKLSGMVHVSEMSDEFVSNIREILSPGDKAVVKVLKIEKNGFIRASLKQVPEDKAKIVKTPREVFIDHGADTLLEKLPSWIENTLKEMNQYV
ncbi:MAG: S1 RNA-binding domain-containing protein [Coprobacillus sp.]|nr:S1 RNA-binding domain-containing protein [Coprobacillus sp.]